MKAWSAFSVKSVYEFPEGIGGMEELREKEEGEIEDWKSVQKTSGPSDLYVQSNVWKPGGSTGWHTHPGHSLIIVTEGAITAYEDSSCTPHVYTPETAGGTGLVDANHVHMIRNGGEVDAHAIAVQLVPHGAPRRNDVDPAPFSCP